MKDGKVGVCGACGGTQEVENPEGPAGSKRPCQACGRQMPVYAVEDLEKRAKDAIAALVPPERVAAHIRADCVEVRIRFSAIVHINCEWPIGGLWGHNYVAYCKVYAPRAAFAEQIDASLVALSIRAWVGEFLDRAVIFMRGDVPALTMLRAYSEARESESRPKAYSLAAVPTLQRLASEILFHANERLKADIEGLTCEFVRLYESEDVCADAVLEHPIDLPAIVPCTDIVDGITGDAPLAFRV